MVQIIFLYFRDGWIGCAAQCAEHPDCEYWTFVTAPVQNRACYLKSACPIPFTDFNAYSGSKECTFWDCSDWSTIDACKSTPAPEEP